MKKMIDLVVAAVRANPARALAWSLVLVIVSGVLFGLSDNLGQQLNLFTR